MKKPRVYLPWGNFRVYSLRKPTSIQIICGDCSSRVDNDGNTELLPLRTFLAKDGRCYTCGSSSIVFASDLCRALRHTIAERKTEPASELNNSPSADASLSLWPGSSSTESLQREPAPATSCTGASSCIN
jgi:hypothetical protein